jgi:hypothetical protein
MASQAGRRTGEDCNYERESWGLSLENLDVE